MNELETQVAKIQIGEPKQATAYVYVLAEKMDATETEIYVLCELPLFNPAAQVDCERICEAIGASLKRSYRRTANDSTFENALAQINEELGKLAGMGKTHWIGKLNALVAAKRGRSLSIATVGKITALLYRDNNFTTMAEATTAPTPLKTFENFAIGKLRLNDLLVFSTTQLLNHISIDRIRQIIDNSNLPEAAGILIEILRDNAGPEVACGTILALQVEPGQGKDEEIDLSPYLDTPVPKVSSVTNAKTKVGKAAAGAITLLKHAQGFGENTLGKLRQQGRPNVKNILNKNKAAVGVVNEQFRKATNQLRPETFRSFSNTKKFFFISAAVLLVALVVSIIITSRYRSAQTQDSQTKATIEQLQRLASDADAALIYGDEAKARSLVAELRSKLDQETSGDQNRQSQIDPIKQQVTELENKLNKTATAKVETVGALSSASHLISLPNYLATETKRTIVSWNRTTKSVQDNVLHNSEPIVLSIFTKGSQAVTYNGKELFVWNFQTGLLGAPFSESVPGQENMAGLAVYPTNNRVYTIDKANNRVVSFLASDRDLSKPVVSVANAGNLSKASDLAIDGNIYILVDGGIAKYNSGARQDFNPSLPSPLSDTAQAYTQSDYKNLYILDSGNKRIIILDKQGGLIATLTAPEFTNMKDFSVDEKAKLMYVLNDSSLLKVSF